MATPANARRSSLASRNEAALLACRTALCSSTGLSPSVPSWSLWPRGEKRDPTGLTVPLLAAQADLPGGAGERPPGQRLAGWRAPLGGPPALGAAGGLVVGGAGVGVVAEVFFEEEGRQFAGKRAGALLALGEGDGGLGLFGVEVEVEDGGSLLEPLLAEALTIGRGQDGAGVHALRRGKGEGVEATDSISPRRRSCNYGNGPSSR